jgi:protein disulfide-isomerase
MTPLPLARRRVALASMLLPLTLATPARAAAAPYDESADARSQIAAALSAAGPSGQRVLVVFGANWCGDCMALESAFRQRATADLIARRFQVVKVNVGRFDRNGDLAQAYGVPLKRGIPAIAVLAADGRVLTATRGGELADARKMGDQGLHAFLARIAEDSR